MSTTDVTAAETVWRSFNQWIADFIGEQTKPTKKSFTEAAVAKRAGRSNQAAINAVFKKSSRSVPSVQHITNIVSSCAV